MPRIPLGDWVNDTVDWLLDHVSWLFDFLKTVFTGTYDGIDAVLQAPQPLLLAGILAVIAFWLRGTLAGLLTFAGFAFIDSLELWEDAMTTLSLVLVATIIALVIAVPVGIWAARSSRVSGIVRPVLDFMQTLPAMIYLIPAILFFGTGASAGIVATLIFALAPGVRMTELGIRQVDKELVEAAEAFGTTPRDTLLRVQLPLALPTVMAGVNQVIMLGLSMAAIAGMVGTGGLGGDVNEAIGQLNVGLGSEAGVAIVILAIYLDRMTSALGTQVSPLGRRAAAKARASQRGLKIWSYRPSPQIAVIGVVVLALVAGGMGIFGGTSGEATAVSGGKDVGQGKKISIGYVPWDDGVASTFLWKEILEERGYQVDAKQFDAGPLYTSLASGNADFMTGAWLPTTHEQYWKKYGGKLDDLGAWYDKTSLELSVPSYMKDINSLADLKGKAARFGGKITGIESSAGEMALLKSKVLGAYGLDKEYEVVDSSTPAMLAELKRAYAKKAPIAVTLWSPHWAYNDYDLKKLKDPKGAWGSGDGIHTVARKGFADDNPVVGGWLKNFKLDEKQLTSLEAEINKAGKGEQQDAVRTWLKQHPGLVDKLAPVKDSGTPAEAKRPVNVAWFPWDEDIAVTYLWKNVLERRGYKLNLKQMDVGPVYTGLASGDLDLNFDAWLPYAQKNYWDKSKDSLADLGTWYRPTSLEVAVPSYVKGVKTYEDLKGKASLFDGKIIGIEPGTGEMNLLKNKVLPGYGLDKEYEVVDGSTPAMLAELKRAYARKQPVAVVLWSPHWAYSQYDLTKLKDDRKLFGEGNTIRTIANEKFPGQYPRLTKWIKGFHMSEDELGTLESEINKYGQGHEEQAVTAWLKEHPEMVGRMTPS
ncbi:MULTISPECIES: ABC transporter permease/substrate binding protein [Streptomyces]|uniref:Glycine betaine ABC transport system permease n=1 Tax=Streptomyces sviceus (strain ATCC 29083 / DSM 924 / JCM 4929 / NBRC 13980 / NCIMB 11184 / NRRL 5439 / UC 5370) TaxID=463191 RepID=B5I8L5_STRX2|nr:MULTISPECIES: ABC transporter permease/substrate binding protein [Streptomyces]EDY61420.1 glycine betaine ABC transport system permease [Streptomyces sviceus ATCC 29083]MYT04677.1 ABC transporter permease subunit [Streptomyces sp. SID5470]